MLRCESRGVAVIGDEEAGHSSAKHDGQGLGLTQMLMAMITRARELCSEQRGIDEFCLVWGQRFPEDRVSVGKGTESVIAG